MEQKKGNSLQTLDRALELLEILATATSPLSAIELSKMLGVNRTTIYAMLNSLTEGHYIEKSGGAGKYVIGYKMFELGLMYRRRFPFVRPAQSHAFSLMEKWNLSIYVAIYVSCGQVLLLTDEYPVGIRVLNEGSMGPAHATAMGKVLLSGMPEDVLRREVEGMELRRFTKNTITEKEALLEALAEIRHQGYAFDDQEYIIGLSCVSVPIKDSNGRTLAALSISGEADRVIANREEILKDASIAAWSISKY